MNNLTIAQKTYLAILLVVAGTWLALEIGVPVYEYQHGKSALTALLAHLAAILKFAVFGIVMLAWVLQCVGVLPTVQADPVLEGSARPASRLLNLAIWIVIALVMVFLFNLFQGGKDGGHHAQAPNLTSVPNSDLMNILINWFPMVIIFGVWIFFLRQFQVKKNRDLDSGKN